jgi:hypothetical protein
VYRHFFIIKLLIMYRPPHLRALDRLVLRLLEAWTHRYGATTTAITQQLVALFKDKDHLEKNLVIWTHAGDNYSTWAIQIIRLLQLRLLEEAGSTFILRIYTSQGSPLLPGRKTRSAFPAGDLWAWSDGLVQVCPISGGPTVLAGACEDSRRLYVVDDPSMYGGDGRKWIIGGVELPQPKFDDDRLDQSA